MITNEFGTKIRQRIAKSKFIMLRYEIKFAPYTGIVVFATIVPQYYHFQNLIPPDPSFKDFSFHHSETTMFILYDSRG